MKNKLSSVSEQDVIFYPGSLLARTPVSQVAPVKGCLMKILNSKPSNVLTVLIFLTMAVTTVAAPAQNTAMLQKGDFVAICGDSITEQKLYSLYMQDYLMMCQPTAKLRTLQAGWSGEQAPGFEKRMENDVLALGPNVATTCYGMNDGGYSPMTVEKAQRYRDAQRAIVKTFKENGVRFIIVGSPGCVDSNSFRKDPVQGAMYNKTLAELRDIAREVAAEENVIFANVFDSMMDVMAKCKDKYGIAYHLAGGDGVHPDWNGHLVMAYAFLKALGCDGNIGTITVDMSSGNAQATTGHKILSAAGGVVEVESSRYPFCFYGEPNNPRSTRGVIEFLPFNEELNRFVLVAKSVSADAKCKVTWGDTSRQYAGSELANGINLAADFLDNPFSEPFSSTEAVFLEQQRFETTLTKRLLHRIPGYLTYVPDAKEDLDRVAKRLCQKDKEIAAASSVSVVPVRHKIKIEITNPG
jgi:lysophospholipase L1-like esterase